MHVVMSLYNLTISLEIGFVRKQGEKLKIYQLGWRICGARSLCGQNWGSVVLFLRKTKSELPVSGWSTDCGEREGGGRKRRGCAFPHWLCNQLQGALRDSIAEHGVQFCHRLRKVTLKGGKAMEKRFWNGIKCRFLCRIQSSPSECVCQKVEREGRLYWKLRLSQSLDTLSSSEDSGIQVRKFHAEYSCTNLR